MFSSTKPKENKKDPNFRNTEIKLKLTMHGLINIPGLIVHDSSVHNTVKKNNSNYFACIDLIIHTSK